MVSILNKKREEKQRKEGYLGRLVNLISDKNRKKKKSCFFPFWNFSGGELLTISKKKKTTKTP